MGLLFAVSDKKLVEIRNKIFLGNAIPGLNKNGFEKSPFSTAWFGRNNLGDYTYELCRLRKDGHLELITTHIVKGSLWVQIFLNIFNVVPKINSLQELKDYDGLQYWLPPNSLTNMRLRSDDTKGPPIFRMLFGKEHKIGSYNSESGLDTRAQELGDLIREDMNNIDHFVKRWHELHGEPAKTDWEGNRI